MTDPELYPVSGDWTNASLDKKKYEELYEAAASNPGGFWLDQASKRLDWISEPTIAGDWSFAKDDFHIKWFADGVLNAAANCVDRHLDKHGDAIAIIWEPDEPGEDPKRVTYRELHAEVCRFASVLRGQGVAKGDRVTLYMPMILETAYAVLACARIGAVHSVVFGGFSADALAGRIEDCGSKLVITADEGRRGGKRIKLKACVDEAAARAPTLERVIVVKATGAEIAMGPRDVWYHQLALDAEADCPAEPMNAEDPLFILYTSGSTGKPKGVLHTTGGYLLWASFTHKIAFDYKPGTVFWCAADIGWVTGHTYILYGPLANGATTLMYEGLPNWPDASRIWQVVDRHNVHTLFTAPTALRALMKDGDGFVTHTSRSSLKLLGSVGEPINPEAWRWFHDVVGEGRAPIVDAWWQTETGGIMIAPLPGAVAMKPGSAAKPLPGVAPQLVDDKGSPLVGVAQGNLCITQSWPGQMRGVWGDEDRFFQAYFTTYPGKYFTGDGCRRDEDGYYWITGRVDDVINVSGHRMGTAEVESALVLHEAVAEAAVVGMPHDVKGQGIYAYVTLNADQTPSDTLHAALVQWVRHEIGPIAAPDKLQFAPALPKTRSGKIMRRILRKIAEGDVSSLGDTSTLADPAVVDDLVANRVA
ncbi:MULTISPECIES: acetate--CoA ligase [unclassified Sphingomonas]|uniref:acetate--CoA ligase n=1 Tax=unclassified Sphingomonas TaxID=196159 RepID=UPI00226AB05F|nr:MULTISPECIES: acetate--CoA ligase [unclassified Sphingomonas]